MPRAAKNGVILHFSNSLAAFPSVIHAVSTRHGGVSPAPFHTLNLSTQVGDAAERVQENVRRLFSALELDPTHIVDARQAQADQVARVTVAQAGSRVNGVDALVTDVPGIPLMLRFADCVPILLYDPRHRAIGIVHAGWRGTLQKVVSRTLDEFESAFGSNMRELVAYIGPSIGPCCYEIGTDVSARVQAAFPNASSLLHRTRGATHFDLWRANATQLWARGVENVEIAGICTADHTQDFYSWRRENAATGRFAAVIALRPERGTV